MADLQEVTVGGSLRIRGNWFSENGFLGNTAGFVFSESSPDALFFEQRTRVNVDAQFTDNVRAFIELDSYSTWGDDNFRRLSAADSSYTPLPQGRITPSSDGVSGTPVNLYQAYIDINEIWGTRFNIRVGRQEVQLGSEFLVGNNDTGSRFSGFSFDGATLQSQWGDFVLRSLYAQLVLNNNATRWEESGDIWFNAFYASYVGFEDMSIDAYALRYQQSLVDEMEAAGFDDPIVFYTIGARFAGARAQFDWDADLAYQFGDSGLPSPFDEINAIGATAKAGYTFDIDYQPRIFVTGSYFSGDDEDQPFNRLFSDQEYSQILDTRRLTNVWIVGGGVGAQVTESIGLTAAANYYNAVEDFGASDSDVGFEVSVVASYQYSEDLAFSAGYARFFAGDGLSDGLFVTANGTEETGGLGSASDEDINYVFLETSITF